MHVQERICPWQLISSNRLPNLAYAIHVMWTRLDFAKHVELTMPTMFSFLEIFQFNIYIKKLKCPCLSKSGLLRV